MTIEWCTAKMHYLSLLQKGALPKEHDLFHAKKNHSHAADLRNHMSRVGHEWRVISIISSEKKKIFILLLLFMASLPRVHSALKPWDALDSGKCTKIGFNSSQKLKLEDLFTYSLLWLVPSLCCFFNQSPHKPK